MTDQTTPVSAEVSVGAFVGVLRRYAEVAHENYSYRALVPEVVLRDAIAVIQDRQPPEGTRLVLMDEGLFEALGADRVEWGEPDGRGWYTPRVSRWDPARA